MSVVRLAAGKLYSVPLKISYSFVAGEVRFPGRYTLTRKDEQVSSILERAGGLTANAYARGFQLIRRSVGEGRIAVDLPRVLRDPRYKDNLTLAAGDSLYIPAFLPTVEVAGQTLRFKRAVIATGARAVEPPIPGLSEAGYLTNETVFNLTQRPPRLAVIGGGPIGCELGQALARLGVKIDIVQSGVELLPHAVRILVLTVGNGQHDGLHRRQPDWKCTGV